MTVMTGLVNNFKVKNHNFVGDCIVGTDSLVGFSYYHEFEKILEDCDIVQASSSAVKSHGILTPAGSDENYIIEVMGIEPAKHAKVTAFGDWLYYNRGRPENAFRPMYDPNKDGCVIGIDLMMNRDQLGQYHHSESLAQIEVVISCFPLTAKGALAKAGTDIVNTKNFFYSDDSQTRLVRPDGFTVFLPIDYAQQLCGMASVNKRVNAIFIKFKPGTDLNIGVEKINSLWKDFAWQKADAKNASLLNNVSVQSWKSYRRAIIAPMEKEHLMMTAAFIMIGVITVFIVLVVIYMIVSHKTKDIGILRSVGVSKINIVSLFLCFAALVGIVGATIGTILGSIFLIKINPLEAWLFENFKFQVWDRSIYAIGDIPNKIEAGLVTVVVVSAIVACLAGAILPTLKAARRNLIETLQVNEL